MREIDHAGHDHVVVVGVVLVFVQKRRTGLVYADVPGACGDHALIAFQHGADHRGVCLHIVTGKGQGMLRIRVLLLR